MTRLRALLRHPFAHAILVLLAAYVIIAIVIPYVPPLVGVHSAPVPSSVMLQYMLTAAVGVLIYVSADELRWRRFQEPILESMVRPERRPVRLGALIVLPLLAGYAAFEQTRPKVSAPVQLRSIHPAPPGQITFRGRTIQLTGLENPLRASAGRTTQLETGSRVYVQNCVACHGDKLDGEGHFAHGFSPAPLPFDASTIAQLTESFVFWRVAKGGPGLPREGAPWSSAMPAWEDILTEEEIWSVILFLYEQSGRQPRTWEASHGP